MSRTMSGSEWSDEGSETSDEQKHNIRRTNCSVKTIEDFSTESESETDFVDLDASSKASVLADYTVDTAFVTFHLLKESHERKALRSISQYLAYLLLVCLALFNQNGWGAERWMVTSAITQSFVTPTLPNSEEGKTVATVTTRNDIYDYLENVWLPAVYFDDSDGLGLGNILLHKLVPTRKPKIQIEYVRARNCSEITPRFYEEVEQIFPVCGYTRTQRSTNNAVDSDFSTTIEFELFGVSESGEPYDLAYGKELLRPFIENDFLDVSGVRGSMPVLMTIQNTYYNVESDLFSHLWMEFVFFKSGIVRGYVGATVPYAVRGSEIFVWRLYPYLALTDWLRLIAEIGAVMGIVVSAVGEIQDMRELKASRVHWLKTYFMADPWNILDWIFVVLGTTLTVMWTYIVVESKAGRSSTRETLLEDDFPSDTLLKVLEAYSGTATVVIGLLGVRTFKYLRHFHTAAVIANTLTLAARELFVFLAVFGGLLLTFTLMGSYFLGHTEYFYTIGIGIYTCFRMAVGELVIPDIDNSNRLLSTVFYITFMTLVYLIFINMFLVIVMGAYDTLRSFDHQFHQGPRLPRKGRTWFRPIFYSNYPYEVEILAGFCHMKWIRPVDPKALRRGYHVLVDTLSSSALLNLCTKHTFSETAVTDIIRRYGTRLDKPPMVLNKTVTGEKRRKVRLFAVRQLLRAQNRISDQQ